MQPLRKVTDAYPLPTAETRLVKDHPAETCAQCDGTGWVRLVVAVDHPDFGKARNCPACHGADRALFQRIWTVSELDPDDAAAPDLPSFLAHDKAAERMVSAAQAFVDDPAGWLTFHGNGNGSDAKDGRGQRLGRGDGRWGSGKSHLGEAIARALLARTVPALYITATRLLQYAGAVWRDGDEDIDYDRRVAWLIGLPVLIVDEVNKESKSDATERLRLQIFDARYVAAMRERGGATVLLSNDRPSRWMDPALASRAMESRFRRVEVTNVDFRQVEH